MINAPFSGSKIICTLMTLLLGSNLYAAGEMRNISSMDIVKEMKLGWNLGNSLDATGGSGLNTETSWGNPVTSKAMIDMVKAKGFKTVRIPVTWNKHYGSAPNYTIDNAWMNRVEEVVNYVLDNNMYAILNTHHDEWITLTASSQAEVSDKLAKLWTQIANRFKDYGDYLILETMNEPRLYGTQYEWNGGTAEARRILNDYNAAAVNAIRTTGGNNALRHIMIPTHAATSMAVAQDDLVIPNNDQRIIVSQHTYWPYSFTMQEPGTNAWGTAKDKSDCDAELDRIHNKFIKNGIPVIIGEWGAIHKNNTAARVVHAEYYTKAALERGMLPVWWDNGWEGDAGFALLNRKTLSWCFPEVADALIRGAGITVSVKGEQLRKEHNELIGSIGQKGVVSYVLHQNSNVYMNAYSLQGKNVFRFSRSNQPAGNYEVSLPRFSMPGGLYVLEVKAGDQILRRRFELLR